MAEKDYALDQLLADKERFADLFNAGLFQGRQLLKPDMLQPVTGKSGIIYLDQEGKKRTLQRHRDVIMEADFGACFALFACEDQMEVHYAMPVRCMLYDALNYTDQVRNLEKEHHDAGDKLTGGEFLSGMKKEDRIVPVFSLVLYLGKKEWDGSRSLYEMIGCGDDGKELLNEMKEYLPDYRINIIWGRRVDDIELFRSSLQYFFGMLKYNRDKDELYNYVKQHRNEIKNLDEASMTAVLILLGEQNRMLSLLKENREKEAFDMSNAIDELIADGEKKGIERGIEKGIEQGIEKGEDCFARLTSLLLADSRMADLLKATSDKVFRATLYQEYGIKEEW